jgi:hypothetical protein
MPADRTVEEDASWLRERAPTRGSKFALTATSTLTVMALSEAINGGSAIGSSESRRALAGEGLDDLKDDGFDNVELDDGVSPAPPSRPTEKSDKHASVAESDDQSSEEDDDDYDDDDDDDGANVFLFNPNRKSGEVAPALKMQWIVDEPCLVSVWLCNPLAVPLRLDSVSLLVTILPTRGGVSMTVSSSNSASAPPAVSVVAEPISAVLPPRAHSVRLDLPITVRRRQANHSGHDSDGSRIDSSDSCDNDNGLIAALRIDGVRVAIGARWHQSLTAVDAVGRTRGAGCPCHCDVGEDDRDDGSRDLAMARSAQDGIDSRLSRRRVGARGEFLPPIACANDSSATNARDLDEYDISSIECRAALPRARVSFAPLVSSADAASAPAAYGALATTRGTQHAIDCGTGITQTRARHSLWQDEAIDTVLIVENVGRLPIFALHVTLAESPGCAASSDALSYARATVVSSFTLAAVDAPIAAVSSLSALPSSTSVSPFVTVAIPDPEPTGDSNSVPPAGALSSRLDLDIGSGGRVAANLSLALPLLPGASLRLPIRLSPKALGATLEATVKYSTSRYQTRALDGGASGAGARSAISTSKERPRSTPLLSCRAQSSLSFAASRRLCIASMDVFALQSAGGGADDAATVDLLIEIACESVQDATTAAGKEEEYSLRLIDRGAAIADFASTNARARFVATVARHSFGAVGDACLARLEDEAVAEVLPLKRSVVAAGGLRPAQADMDTLRDCWAQVVQRFVIAWRTGGSGAHGRLALPAFDAMAVDDIVRVLVALAPEPGRLAVRSTGSEGAAAETAAASGLVPVHPLYSSDSAIVHALVGRPTRVALDLFLASSRPSANVAAQAAPGDELAHIQIRLARAPVDAVINGGPSRGVVSVSSSRSGAAFAHPADDGLDGGVLLLDEQAPMFSNVRV